MTLSTAFRRKVAAEISPCRRAVLIVNQSKRPRRLDCGLTNLHFLKYNSCLTEVKWISNSKNPITLFDDRIFVCPVPAFTHWLLFVPLSEKPWIYWTFWRRVRDSTTASPPYGSPTTDSVVPGSPLLAKNVPPGRFLTLGPSRARIPCYKKSEAAQRQPPIFGGELGIRTLETFRSTAFRVRCSPTAFRESSVRSSQIWIGENPHGDWIFRQLPSKNRPVSAFSQNGFKSRKIAILGRTGGRQGRTKAERQYTDSTPTILLF